MKAIHSEMSHKGSSGHSLPEDLKQKLTGKVCEHEEAEGESLGKGPHSKNPWFQPLSFLSMKNEDKNYLPTWRYLSMAVI